MIHNSAPAPLLLYAQWHSFMPMNLTKRPRVTPLRILNDTISRTVWTYLNSLMLPTISYCHITTNEVIEVVMIVFLVVDYDPGLEDASQPLLQKAKLEWVLTINGSNDVERGVREVDGDANASKFLRNTPH